MFVIFISLLGCTVHSKIRMQRYPIIQNNCGLIDESNPLLRIEICNQCLYPGPDSDTT